MDGSSPEATIARGAGPWPAGEPATSPFADARRADSRGHALHLGAAALYLVLLASTTAGKDFGAIPLIVVALLRLRHTAPCYAILLRDWIVLGMAAWIAALALSLLWSSDPAMGAEHLRAFRPVIVSLALWPLLDRPRPLVAAFVAGCLVQVVVQGLQAAEVLGLSPGMNGRLYGTLHPIQTATMLAAASLWCWAGVATTPARRPGWLVALLIAGTATAVGVVLTGSRGPWIALAVAGAWLAAVCLVRIPRSRPRVLVGAAMLLVAGLAAWPVVGGFVQHRVEQARADLAAAGDGRFDTDVGFRLESYRVAASLAAEHPLVGHGAGSFGVEAVRKSPEFDWSMIPNAHSVWLTSAVETGVPVLIMVLALFTAATLRNARRAATDPLAAGTSAVLVLLVVAGCFDTAHHSGSMNGLIQLALVLSIPAAGPARRTQPATARVDRRGGLGGTAGAPHREPAARPGPDPA